MREREQKALRIRDAAGLLVGKNRLKKERK